MNCLSYHTRGSKIQGAILGKLVESLSVKFAKHKDFDSFLDACSPNEQQICLRIRQLILQNFPTLKENWAYGAPFYKGRSRICFIYPASLPYSGLKEGVNFGFNRGNLLSNDHGLLILGARKEVAYISALTEKDVREDLFLEILHEAVILDEVTTLKKRTISQ
jgi:hypothetical protein